MQWHVLRRNETNSDHLKNLLQFKNIQIILTIHFLN